MQLSSATILLPYHRGRESGRGEKGEKDGGMAYGPTAFIRTLSALALLLRKMSAAPTLDRLTAASVEAGRDFLRSGGKVRFRNSGPVNPEMVIWGLGKLFRFRFKVQAKGPEPEPNRTLPSLFLRRGRGERLGCLSMRACLLMRSADRHRSPDKHMTRRAHPAHSGCTRTPRHPCVSAAHARPRPGPRTCMTEETKKPERSKRNETKRNETEEHARKEGKGTHLHPTQDRRVGGRRKERSMEKWPTALDVCAAGTRPPNGGLGGGRKGLPAARQRRTFRVSVDAGLLQWFLRTPLAHGIGARRKSELAGNELGRPYALSRAPPGCASYRRTQTREPYAPSDTEERRVSRINQVRPPTLARTSDAAGGRQKDDGHRGYNPSAPPHLAPEKNSSTGLINLVTMHSKRLDAVLASLLLRVGRDTLGRYF
ncbi:hypothetical protein B0H17DRAFT_1144864 [Mycena rosella]|uniref:Uncharacterized protein n=1 Tax=Mycena rosella TaxID=1033263 RepID=A0AAD7CSI9_MYCRO|nr:hypothetical protein B0H17DRAFT_1144864 [Mycena rosella]